MKNEREPAFQPSSTSAISDKFQYRPKGWVIGKREVPIHAQELVAKFLIPNGVIHSKAGVLVGIKSRQDRGGEKRLEPIATFRAMSAKRQIREIGKRSILLRPIDLHLGNERFILIRSTASGQKQEVVTESAGPVARPCIARINPERQPI
jgi:hypothetical protein